MPDSPDLAALIASRICHDLISPIGAISNGVELLAMSAPTPGPEMELLSQSVAQANARVRFFRIGFGAASASQAIGSAEISAVLADLGRGGRISFAWTSASQLPRREARLAFLLLLCAESALAYGGTVTVTEQASRWQIQIDAPRLRVEPALWSHLAGGPIPEPLAASQIQFALAARALVELDRTLATGVSATSIRLTF